MENYFAKLVWTADAVLLILSVLMGIFTVASVLIKRTAEKRREANIKYLKALGDIGEAEKIAQGPGNKWHRIEAIMALGSINSPRALEILKQTMLEPDEDISYFSIVALGHIKSADSARALLSAIKNRALSGYKVASILETFPPDIANELIAAAQDPDPLLRFWAVRLLSRFKAKRYAYEISRLTQDSSPDIRAAACECLGEIAEKEAAGAIRRCLADPVWYVRIHAIKALEKLSGTDFIPEAAGLLEDPDWFVQENIKRIVIKGIENFLPRIQDLLKTGNQRIRNFCLEVLEVSGYTDKILRAVVSDDVPAKDNALRFLSDMLNAGAHFGLEGLLAGYPPDMYAKILSAIASLDKKKAEHIDKIARGEAAEI